MRKSIDDMVTPEAVRDNWATVTDMTGAKSYDTITVRLLCLKFDIKSCALN